MKVGDIEDDNAAVWFLQAYDVRGITGLVTVFVIIQGKTVRIFVTTVGSNPTLSAERKVLAKSVDFYGLPALDLLKNGCECAGFYALA